MRAVAVQAYVLLAETLAGLFLLDMTTEVVRRYLQQAAMLLVHYR